MRSCASFLASAVDFSSLSSGPMPSRMSIPLPISAMALPSTITWLVFTRWMMARMGFSS
jgi:hypothetical protein